MFANKKEDLNSILKVFQDTKVKLTNFIDEKSSQKSKLEEELTVVNSDLDKSKEILAEITKLTK